MNTHSIELDGYYARFRGSNAIYLGTAGSHGNEQLQVTQSKGWEGLTVKVVFHPSKVAVQLPANGLLDVPWEATAQPLTAMQGRIVFQGFDQDRLVNSIDLAYTVASHSPALGRDENPYTPGIVEGVLNQMAADKDAILQAAQQTGQAKEAAAASAAEAAGSAANAQQSAGASNASASQAASSASQAASSAAAAGEMLTQVQTAGQEAQQKIKDAETDALDKITASAPALPAISADAAWQSVTIKPDGTGYNLAALAPIEATIRPTVTGNPAVCQNSVAWGLQGLKIYGKSVQNGTPSPENPVPIVSAGESSTVDVTVYGANIGDFSLSNVVTKGWTSKAFQIENGLKLVANDGWGLFIIDTSKFYGTDLTMSFDYKQIVSETSSDDAIHAFSVVSLEDIKYPENQEIIFDKKSPHIEKTHVSTKLPARNYLGFFMSLSKEGAGLNRTVEVTNISVNVGNNEIPYMPYQSQLLALPTPNSLPGIPVISGGNYTDNTGQQWVADEINFGSRQYVQNCGSTTFDGSADENWILETETDHTLARFSIFVSDMALSPVGLCNCLPWTIVPATDAQTEQIGGHTEQSRLHVIISASRLAETTVNDFKMWLASNPLDILYQLASASNTDISAETFAAYHIMTTYSGTTVVSTAQPVAGLEVQYVSDGTKYAQKVQSMESRLSALEDASIAG